MGRYLNPGAGMYKEALNSKIYVDKSPIISYTNESIGTRQKYMCVSRPRRFGKSMTAEMLTAYYDKTADSEEIFQKLKIGKIPDGLKFCNKFDVIKLNMQEFLSRTNEINSMIERIKFVILRDIESAYPDIKYLDHSDLIDTLYDVYKAVDRQFIFIIDEWDCIFREYKNDTLAQTKYLDFLRDLFKDKEYVGLVYMTGILPIKKYGTNSALNMFTEFSMENSGPLAQFIGFTETEVQELCTEYHFDFEECKAWYNGYYFPQCGAIYNPNSIVKAILLQRFDDYWNQTETYDALRIYIDMNFDGLKDSIIKLMAGERQVINTGSFQNDMTNFSNADDVMTLLIHLGYLGYDIDTKEVFIPNNEIMREFVTATTAKNSWDEVMNSVKKSDELLNATWNLDNGKVANYIENAHFETSHLQYNDENALSYTISLAYYSARQYYTVIRELPAGKGFADLAFIPRKKYSDKPAMIVELKWDKSQNTAINQIKNNEYPEVLSEYKDNLLLVGINYDKKTKNHECRIDKV